MLYHRVPIPFATTREVSDYYLSTTFSLCSSRFLEVPKMRKIWRVLSEPPREAVSHQFFIEDELHLFVLPLCRVRHPTNQATVLVRVLNFHTDPRAKHRIGSELPRLRAEGLTSFRAVDAEKSDSHFSSLPALNPQHLNRVSVRNSSYLSRKRLARSNAGASTSSKSPKACRMATV